MVDAFQGVEAQTMANAYAAMEHDLKIIPVINKIDLVHARVDESAGRNGAIAGHQPGGCSQVQRQNGIGVPELFEAIIQRIPAPGGDPNAPLQAMVFDSHYDDYRGAITYVRLLAGTVKKNDKLKFLRADANMKPLK